jgi:hypothetical protein
MKKHIFSLVAMLVFALTIQAQTFSGLTIGGSLATFNQNMITKGYLLNKRVAPHIYYYTGKIATENVEVFVFATPTTKQVAKVSVFYPKNTTFESINNKFDQKKDVLTSKYGSPDKCHNYFESPYELGDGYEENAIQLEKYVNSCFWHINDNFDMSLSVTKYMQVEIIFENIANQNKLIEELDKMESDKL